MQSAQMFSLLEGAASAAGIEFSIKTRRSGAQFAGQIREGRWEWWNPLNDNGDCFKLETACRITVTVDFDKGSVYAYHSGTDTAHKTMAKDFYGDYNAARRAASTHLAYRLHNE